MNATRPKAMERISWSIVPSVFPLELAGLPYAAKSSMTYRRQREHRVIIGRRRSFKGSLGGRNKVEARSRIQSNDAGCQGELAVYGARSHFRRMDRARVTADGHHAFAALRPTIWHVAARSRAALINAQSEDLKAWSIIIVIFT